MIDHGVCRMHQSMVPDPLAPTHPHPPHPGATAFALPLGGLLALAGAYIVYRARDEKKKKKEARRQRREERRRRRAERAANANGAAANGAAAEVGEGNGLL